jgi:hypothetical protein
MVRSGSVPLLAAGGAASGRLGGETGDRGVVGRIGAARVVALLGASH